MNQEIKREWIKRLRSGNYKQGRTVLHNEPLNTYCCLGVLCEIAVEQKVIDFKVEYDGIVDYDDKSGTLSFKVQKWAGVRAFGEFGPCAESKSLSNLNDNGVSFAEIADVIEREF